MFETILENGFSGDIANVMICVVLALVLGFVVALVYMKTEEHYSKSMAVSMAVMPAVVCAIISAVNGNLGAGIAVMGVFALVRFRSKPGNAKDILYVLFDMSIGVVAATGYIFYTLCVTALIALVLLILKLTHFAETDRQARRLVVTIPENLDYENIFDDIFAKYLDSWSLSQVKTTNLGSLFELRYDVKLKKDVHEKELIDELRMRNGNLTILCTKRLTEADEL